MSTHSPVVSGGGGKSPAASVHTSPCRILIQQCENAQLSFDTEEDPAVSIRRGIVVYVCFLLAATDASIDIIAKTILETKLCEPSISANSSDHNKKRVTPLEFISSTTGSSSGDDYTNRPIFDVLLVPQATLCGKLKGKAMQYHGLIGKTDGKQLFMKLVETIRKMVGDKSGQCIVNHGVYGARQILKMETNGPFSHVIDL